MFAGVAGGMTRFAAVRVPPSAGRRATASTNAVKTAANRRDLSLIVFIRGKVGRQFVLFGRRCRRKSETGQTGYDQSYRAADKDVPGPRDFGLEKNVEHYYETGQHSNQGWRFANPSQKSAHQENAEDRTINQRRNRQGL